MSDVYDDDWDDDLDEFENEFQPLYCRACDYEVLDEDALRCPLCGEYLATGYVWRGRGGCWTVLGVLGILAVVLALSVL